MYERLLSVKNDIELAAGYALKYMYTTPSRPLIAAKTYWITGLVENRDECSHMILAPINNLARSSPPPL